MERFIALLGGPTCDRKFDAVDVEDAWRQALYWAANNGLIPSETGPKLLSLFRIGESAPARESFLRYRVGTPRRRRSSHDL